MWKWILLELIDVRRVGGRVETVAGRAMSELQMSEIEIGTEILIAISALGIIVFFLWQLRRLKRESVDEQKKPSEPQEPNVDRR